MRNYNLPHLTDASDYKSLDASRKGLTQALQKYHPLSEGQREANRRVLQRAYGNATPAQAMFLLATVETFPKVWNVQSPGQNPEMAKDRIDGTCNVPCTTKELNVLIRITNGSIKGADLKLAWIASLSAKEVREAVQKAMSSLKLVERHGVVQLPEGGLSGLKGFLKAHELLPRVAGEVDQDADNIIDMFG